jgi:hypothetical protein
VAAIGYTALSLFREIMHIMILNGPNLNMLGVWS